MGRVWVTKTYRLVYHLYGLTQEERDAIGYIDFHKDNEGEADDDE